MDPLSTTASIIAVLQIASDVVKYIVTAKGATKERRRLREEIFACESVLLQLQDHIDDADGGGIWWEKIKALEGPNTPLHRLWAAFEIIKTKLEPKRGLNKALSVLKWPFNEEETEKFILIVQRELSLLQLSLTMTCRDLILAVREKSTENGKLLAELIQMIRNESADLGGSIRELRKHQIESERQAIINWLTPVDYAIQQSDFINRRQSGTGKWLLDSPEFSTWLNTEAQTLFCPGIPGAGKTILTSIVVDDLYKRFCNDSTVGLAFVYCNFQQQHEQSVEDLVASLLKQLVQGLPELTDSIRSLYNKHKGKQMRPSFHEVTEVLQSVASIYSRLFIIIDALDECQTSPGCRARLLGEIFGLQTNHRANIFATSRTIADVKEIFEGSMTLEIRAMEEDIQRYIDSHIMYLPTFVGRDPALQEEIKTGIIGTVDGMFLLVQLHLDSLVGKRSPKAVRVALSKLPTGSQAYNQAYEAAMERICKQVADQAELAKQVLYWITCAKRPLTILELQHALAIEIGESELDRDNLPQIEDMISACCGLVTVDENRGVIRLVHYTTQEYFERTQKHWFPGAEDDITTACLTYLSFDVFESGFCESNDEFEKRLLSNPLYDYAARNWGHHALNSSIGTSQLTLDFLQNEPKSFAASQAMMIDPDRRYGDSGLETPRQMTGMHLAAYLGLRDTIAAFLEDSNEPDRKDSKGRTPLSYAAERGCETVVSLLLTIDGVNPNSQDCILGWTPLWHAVAANRTTIVAILLAEEAVDADAKSQQGRTPLSWAANRGNEAIVRLLLEKCTTNPDSADPIYGDTPLQSAASNGHDRIVQILLDRAEVDPNSKDRMYGRTSLSWAAERGHIAVVKVLLADERTDFSSKSKTGRSPLWFARERGHEAIINLLKEKMGPNHEPEGLTGPIPLWYAAESDQEVVAKLLLEDGVDPDQRSQYGRTPLSYAAERGHEGIVELLLQQDKVDPDSKDPEYRRTPLSWAAANGHEKVVKILLDREAVNPDSKSEQGRTAVSWAAGFGHEKVVKLLLLAGADPDSRSDSERTPLSHAAERGHEAVVSLLLKNGGVNPISKDSKYLRTPLAWAAMNGHHVIVELLSDSMQARGKLADLVECGV
ncbi:Ankyrin-1 [Orbilia brochopaga]|nr:Ankyrin-1 [Drechslerella brochopaga]